MVSPLAMFAAAAISALTPEQVLATLNRAWVEPGRPPFISHGVGTLGHLACSGRSLCLMQDTRLGTLTLTGDVSSQDRSSGYLMAQALLVGLVSSGAPAQPAITADRLAVTDGKPANAQLGPVCMRVEPFTGQMLSTTFERRRCLAAK